MFEKILSSSVLAAIFGSIAGCNTVEGLGKDVERAGEATRDTAADVKRKM